MARPIHPVVRDIRGYFDWQVTDSQLSQLTDEEDECVEVEVALALALVLVLGPDGGQHAQRLGHEHHRPRRLVHLVLVEVVKLLLQ